MSAADIVADLEKNQTQAAASESQRQHREVMATAAGLPGREDVESITAGYPISARAVGDHHKAKIPVGYQRFEMKSDWVEEDEK